MIYLDNAATTLIKPPSVSRAVARALRECGGAGRGGHKAAMRAAEIIYSARETAAGLFCMKDPSRIIFTHNCTHALNIAIKALCKPGGRVVISGFEHNAVLRPLHKLSVENGVKLQILQTPLFEPEMAVHLFELALRDETDLVVCTYVSNVFGYVLPIDRIWKLCSERGVPMVVDAAQAAGILPVRGDLGPYWCMPGHKSLYGPQGTGILICSPNAPLLSTHTEGGTGSASSNADMPDFYPDRLETGTPNAHGIAGLEAGMKYIMQQDTETVRGHLRDLYDGLSYIRKVRCFTAENFFCQSGVLSFNIENKDSETVAASIKGFAVRAGLHCAPLAHKTAGTLPGGTVRVSPCSLTTSHEIEKFIKAVNHVSAQ